MGAELLAPRYSKEARRTQPPARAECVTLEDSGRCTTRADTPLLIPDAGDPRFVVAVLFFNLDDRLCSGKGRRKVDETLERVEIHPQTVSMRRVRDRLPHSREVLNHREWIVEMVQQLLPLLVVGGPTEAFGMRFDRIPLNE